MNGVFSLTGMHPDMPRRHAHRRSHRSNRGFSLLEVLIAVLVMGVGLLGIAAMQATALRNSQSASEKSQAVIQTYAILDAMRANRDAANVGEYNMAMTCTTPAGGSLAQNDLHSWMTSLKTSLGSDVTTCAQISCDSGQCKVSVRWDDSRGSSQAGTNAAGSATRMVETVTRI